MHGGLIPEPVHIQKSAENMLNNSLTQNGIKQCRVSSLHLRDRKTVFDPRLVENADANPWDMEGQLH